VPGEGAGGGIVIFDRLVKSSPASTTIFDVNQLAAIIYGTGKSSAGVHVTPQRAMQHAAVFSCVRVLAESVGQLPLHLYEIAADGKSKAKAIEHPLYDILNTSPNSYMTAQEFAELEVAHLALRGNFYGFKNVVRGNVTEILPLNPAAVTPKLTEDGSDLVYDVTFENGTRDILDASEVYHVKLFSLDGISGLSPISQNRESIGLSIAAEQHGARLFSNGAMPGGILSTPQTLKKDSHQRIKDSWNEIHQGVENSHRVAILEAGMQWTKTGLTAEEAQFLETRKFSRSEIAGIFRVPPHKIGDLERSTNNNIEQQSLDFYTDGLMPYLTRIESRTRFSLLKPSDRRRFFAKFDVRSLLRADIRSKGAYYDSMVRNGAMSPNEIREEEDRNPRKGGDIYLTPSNMNVNGQPATPAADPNADQADPAKPN
jgi:HK97 family phage portal protein